MIHLTAFQLTNMDGDYSGIYLTFKTEGVQEIFDQAFDNEEEDIQEEADRILAEKGIFRVFAQEVTTDKI